MNHIKELRKKHGYSQQALAKILYVNQTAVSQWERGVTTPSAPILLRLCELFSTSTDYLLGRDSVDTYEKREPGTQTDAELSELNSIISRLSDGNRAKLRELAQLYLDSEQRKEENG